eukprot:CAMPEP_0117677930 /NCGR_PEP_ID=MMETSP0804-20121206/17006_1 /TAXON_ID=1074897 /ORGANISM="Tetraselmis astigmatica, Strain CCMP880" /LENGTH=177 /DNA_ID=CAMNT_0005487243 /DNA_START=104 /DNA_END=634 /DNA_ORIENTATION=-
MSGGYEPISGGMGPGAGNGYDGQSNGANHPVEGSGATGGGAVVEVPPGRGNTGSGTPLDDSSVPVRAPPGPGRRFDSELTPGKLFVGGLDQRTTQEALVEYCKKWGELVDSVIMPGRGFGFVTFAHQDSADAFLNHTDHVLDGKRVEAKPAVPRGGAGGGMGGGSYGGRGGGGGGGG